MKLNDFLNLMEELAPTNLAMSFDNVGLLVGTDKKEIKKVLVALDCTIQVAKEAIEGNYDLVLCHHPIIREPVNRILHDQYSTQVIYTLIRNGIGMYAAHTNLDAVTDGVNDVLASIFELQNIEVEPVEKIARVGDLKMPIKLSELVKNVDEKLNAKSKCATANFERDLDKIEIKRVAVLGGSGGSSIDLVKAMHADVLITGEVKHSQAIEASTKGLSIIQAGHYETEVVVLKHLITHLQSLDNSVEYTLTSCETPSLR